MYLSVSTTFLINIVGIIASIKAQGALHLQILSFKTTVVLNVPLAH